MSVGFNIRELIRGKEQPQIGNVLRPTDFSNYIGQEDLKKNLSYIIEATQKRQAQGSDEALEHVLLYGSAGLGKTTMSMIIAHAMGARIHYSSGPIIEQPQELASLLTKLQAGDVLFIDEIHRLKINVEEVLYSAMEDFKLDVMLGKDKQARSIRLNLPKFTLIGATTHAGDLSAPLRDRFGLVERLEFYKPSEIGQIIGRSAKILDIDIETEAIDLLSARARNTPRIANKLLRRARDYTQTKNSAIITTQLATDVLDLLKIDSLGLDSGDRLLLSSIIDNYNGGPVGVDALASATGEDRATIECFYEPYLLQSGLLERTSRGRRATTKAYQHLNRAEPSGL